MRKKDQDNTSLKNLLYIAGFFLLLLAFYGLRYIAGKEYQPDSLVKKTENTIYSIDNQCFNTTKKVFGFLHQKKRTTWQYLNRYLSDRQANILIQRGDSLIYWNNNLIPARQLTIMTDGKVILFFYGGKPFVGLKTSRENYTVGVFYPLSKKILPFNVKIEKGITSEKNEYPLKAFNVRLKIMPGVFSPMMLAILFLLYVALIIYLILLLSLLYKKFDNRLGHRYSFLLLLSFIIDLIILRGIQYYLGFPEIFDHSFWVSGEIISLPSFETPADLVINFVLFYAGLLLLRHYLQSRQNPWQKRKFLKVLPLQFILFSLPVGLYYITESILQNGGLILFPENVYFSTTGIMRLVLLLVVNVLLYLWVDGYLGFFKQKGVSFGQIIGSLTAAALLFLLPTQINKMLVIELYLLMLLLTAIIWFVERIQKPYFHSILTILLFSLSAAYLLNTNELENREAHQRFTANLLTQKQDPYLQYLVTNRAKAILNDSSIINTISSFREDKEQQISNILRKNYFHDMLHAYSKQVTLCEPGQQLRVQPDNKVVGCDAFFRQLKGRVVDSGTNFELSLVDNSTESIYYLARFHYPNYQDSKEDVNLYVEFYTNIIPKGLGYPELLQDAGAEKLHLSGYSFAYYEQGKLEYKFGDFLYPIDLSDFKNASLRKFFNKDSYIHYMQPDSKTEYLIVSRQAQTLSGWLLPFSLMFILSGFLLLVYVFFKFGKQILETFSYSFSTRLQLSIFTSMFIVFLFLTAIILYYFNVNNKQTISNHLKEKTHSVLIALQHKLSPYGNNALQSKEEIQSYLQKLSMVFFSDINLYDNSGMLVVSSRPEIFRQDLQPKRINSKAYTEIVKNHKLFYLGKEKIRHLEFYSSYAPFILNNGIEAGIINLPYFARQSELQHTYYQMLANLINVFVITGMLGMLLMVYLSRLLTRPLNILQQKITSVSIEKQNEKITWNRNDEIGKLIEAYNQMVEKLEESARLMKYSAREKAWREMARQIAHEIRNPLTPMKLNVQYLQKVYSAKDPSFDEKFKSISRSLISQIDTMDEVAGMFSDFSKIKMPMNEKANLMEAIRSTATLFSKSYKVNIAIDSKNESIIVETSMQDLLRVFNNILKNAVQSMESRQDKNIQIQVLMQQKMVEVQVTDNGKGIGKTDQEHIFQPYFTTKSTGTGLGLAIVKNLMTEMGGEIIFVSEKGMGTTFILRFPLS